MVRGNSRVTLAIVMWGASMFVSCSVALNWDPDGLPCDVSGGCAIGFSCLGNACVGDRSLDAGETCNADLQCEEELVCGFEPRVCRARCANFYSERNTQCRAGTYCRPFPSESGLTGECVPTECQTDNDCDTNPNGDTCVQISSTSSACLVGCEVSFDPAGEYQDNCGSTASSPQTCQPLGLGVGRRFVCLDTDLAAQDSGNTCDPFNAQDALTCVPGNQCRPEGAGFRCRRYCETTRPAILCENNEFCCGMTDVDDKPYGVCLTQCP